MSVAPPSSPRGELHPAVREAVERRTASGSAGRIRGSVLRAAEPLVAEQLLAPLIAAGSDQDLEVVGELGGPVAAAFLRHLKPVSLAACVAYKKIGGPDAVDALVALAEGSTANERRLVLEVLQALAAASGAAVADGITPGISEQAVALWTESRSPLARQPIGPALKRLDEIAAAEPYARVVRDQILTFGQAELQRERRLSQVDLTSLPQAVIDELARHMRQAKDFERLYHVTLGQMQIQRDVRSNVGEARARSAGPARGPRPERPAHSADAADAATPADVAGAAAPAGTAPEAAATPGDPAAAPKKRRRRGRRGGRGRGGPGAGSEANVAGAGVAPAEEGAVETDGEPADEAAPATQAGSGQEA